MVENGLFRFLRRLSTACSLSGRRRYGRRGLYEALEKAPATGDAAARCKAKHLAFFEAKGLGIEDPVVREEVAALSREIGRQCANFERDINADTADVKLKRYELQGVPESLLDSLPSDDGGVTVKVSMKAPILTPVLQNAIDGKTRRKVYVASKKRVVPNCGRLNRVVQVRAGVAKRLGKASHAAHQLERNVCATPEECKAFLDRAAARLKPIRGAPRGNRPPRGYIP